MTITIQISGLYFQLKDGHLLTITIFQICVTNHFNHSKWLFQRNVIYTERYKGMTEQFVTNM